MSLYELLEVCRITSSNYGNMFEVVKWFEKRLSYDFTCRMIIVVINVKRLMAIKVVENFDHKQPFS